MREDTRHVLLNEAKRLEAHAASRQSEADSLLERAAELDAQAAHYRQAAEGLRADALDGDRVTASQLVFLTPFVTSPIYDPRARFRR